jgi:hypothetical protein
MLRLEDLSPELVASLRTASVAQQRAASLAACEFAVSHANIKHRVVEKTLTKLRATGVLNPKEIGEIESLRAKLDDKYFDLQAAAEKGGGKKDEYLREFGKARAVSSLCFAGIENPFEAATEAIYEAAATIRDDDKSELFCLVESVLK